MPPFSSFLNTPSQTSTSQPSTPSPSLRLSNESFSFSWLAGDVDKPSLELGPYVVSAHRSSTSDAYEFDFGLSRPAPLSPVLAHADQIFSDGFLLPLHAVDQSKNESTTTSTSESSSDSRSLSRSLSLDSSESYISFSNRYRPPQYPRSCDPTSRLASLEGSPLFPTSGHGGTKTNLPFLRSCMSFLFPWRNKARRLSFLRSKTQITAHLTAVGDFSTAQRCRGRRISDDSYHDSAIHEAILHCKKSSSPRGSKE